MFTFKCVPFLSDLRHLNIRYFSRCKTFLQRIYSFQEKQQILNKINEKDVPIKSVSASQIKKIYQYVEKQQLSSLEDLLKINGIGPKVLRKICDSILGFENSSEEKAGLKKKTHNNITPPIDDLKKRELICITAIHIGVEHVSWALINSVNKCLLEWDFKEYCLEKGSWYNSLLVVENVTSLLPDSNIYLFEEMGTGKNMVDYNRNVLTAMLSSYVQASRRRNEETAVVAFLKPSVKNKMYNGSVGSERISLQNHVVSIIEERSQTDCISFPKELKDKYFSMKPSTKEDMAQALLLATSFINIILNKRPMNF